MKFQEIYCTKEECLEATKDSNSATDYKKNFTFYYNKCRKKSLFPYVSPQYQMEY